MDDPIMTENRAILLNKRIFGIDASLTSRKVRSKSADRQVWVYLACKGACKGACNLLSVTCFFLLFDPNLTSSSLFSRHISFSFETDLTVIMPIF